MKHRRLPLFVIIPFLLLFGVGLCVLLRPATQPMNSISGNGVIEASEVDVSTKASGEVQRVLVDEGDDVKSGELIATLDSGELSGQLIQAEGALQAAKAGYADLKAGTRPEDIRRARSQLGGALAALRSAQAHRDLVRVGARQEEIEQLRLAYEQANAVESIVREGPRKEDVAQLQVSLAQAQITLADAEREYKRLDGLLKEGAVAQITLDQQQTRRDLAQASVNAAQERLNEARNGARPGEVQAASSATGAARQRLIAAKKGARPEERREADMAVALAQTQVDAARAVLDVAINGPTKDTLSAALARIEQAQGGLDTASAALRQATITAPSNGRVVLRLVEPGELVTPGMPLVRIAKLDKVWIRIYVPEERVGRIKTGQTAVVTTDASTRRRYTGRVTQISQEPEFTPRNVQTREERVKLMYGIKIEVENPDRELKPGMPGDAAIDVQ